MCGILISSQRVLNMAIVAGGGSSICPRLEPVKGVNIIVIAVGLVMMLLSAPAVHAQPRDTSDRPGANFEQYFKGRLGHYPVELHIKRHGDNLTGQYIQRFKFRQRSIPLSGYIDRQGQLHLDGKGIFKGKMENGRIKGFWYRSEDSREKYRFTLHPKNPPYHQPKYWINRQLKGSNSIRIPREASLQMVERNAIFKGRLLQLQSIQEIPQHLEACYRIDLPTPDSSILDRLKLELAVYNDIDSLDQLMPLDTAAGMAADSLLLDDKSVEVVSLQEGTTSGSYHSKLYFYRNDQSEQAFLGHLFFYYTNPWVYGNPYSKQDYGGPHITDMNRLIEMVEMIIASL